MPKQFHATMLERAIGRTAAGWRGERGLSLSEASKRVGFSAAKLSMMENALQPSAPVDVMALGYVYGVPTPEWQALEEAARWAAQHRLVPSRTEALFEPAHDFAHIHAGVTHLRTFQGELIPGVFQTDDYTLATLTADDPLRATVIAERQSAVRAAWRARLYDREPLVVEAVISEAVLRQAVGGARTMHAQLINLIEISELVNVTIQVIPRRAGAYPAMGFPFAVLSFPHPRHNDVVYVENFLRGEYIEDLHDCQRCTQRFAMLQKVALSPCDSVDLIADVASRLPRTVLEQNR